MTQENDDKAIAWAGKHREHIKAMIDAPASDNGHCAPSKEDKGSPELWKASHWRWFFCHSEVTTDGE